MAYAWVRINGNSILEGDGFHISYNPSTLMDIPVFAGDGSGEETALCVDDKFYILNGDFRKEYEKAFEKGLAACVKVFQKHEHEYKSSWSNDLESLAKLSA
jgi:hypothetical protein